MTGQAASWTTALIICSAWSPSRPMPISATSASTRLLSGPRPSRSVDRAITSWPRATTVALMRSSRSSRSFAIRTWSVVFFSSIGGE